MWVKKFQTFSKGKDPDQLSTSDGKDFLTFLAVQRRVAASSQNQAFNALRFFFRNILKKEFEKVDAIADSLRRMTDAVAAKAQSLGFHPGPLPAADRPTVAVRQGGGTLQPADPRKDPPQRAGRCRAHCPAPLHQPRRY
jgi:hypothetical protein